LANFGKSSSNWQTCLGSDGPPHSDIRTTELYFVRKEEDGEVAARRIQIHVPGRKGSNT
jgi:hypothetical protein